MRYWLAVLLSFSLMGQLWAATAWTYRIDAITTTGGHNLYITWTLLKDGSPELSKIDLNVDAAALDGLTAQARKDYIDTAIKAQAKAMIVSDSADGDLQSLVGVSKPAQ